MTITERYEWLIGMVNWIRAQKEPQPQQLFRTFVLELGQVLQFDALAKFDAASNIVEWYLGPGLQRLEKASEETHEQIDINERLTAWVYTHQKTITFSTLDQETRFSATTRILRQAALQSVCAVPMSDGRGPLGSLLIASVHRDAYSPTDVRFCALVANQISLSIDETINSRASQRVQERLKLLLDLTNRVISKLNLRDALREISANIRRVMQCDGVGIELPSPEDQKLRVYALDFPEHPSEIEEGGEPPADEKTGAARAFQSGEAVILSRKELELAPLSLHFGLQSLAHVPLIGRSGIVGVLSLGTYREGAFATDDLPFLTQIARQVALAIENAMAFGEVSDLKNRFAQERLYLEDEIRSELKFGEIVFKSEALLRILQQVETVAPTDSTVLIYGETGTGKELIARAVHNLSTRRSNAFVKLNCAAIPTGLLESELFGHERGAFTGAISQRVGRFELANHGTIFLDEIGEVPLELQPKLLRVLQEREFERLGSTRTLRSDARLIAATNRDLEASVKEQKFRSDLYYRLNVFPIGVPALRERPEDIPPLVRHYVREFSRRLGKTIDTITSETMTTLIRYPWPGNVRELQNVIERAVILTTGPVFNIPSDDLRMPNNAPLNPTDAVLPSGLPDEGISLELFERELILKALRKYGGNQTRAARYLGLSRRTLAYRLEKYGIHSDTRKALKQRNADLDRFTVGDALSAS
jgi:formate hydrogenlyase transcriptional activator